MYTTNPRFKFNRLQVHQNYKYINALHFFNVLFNTTLSYLGFLSPIEAYTI